MPVYMNSGKIVADGRDGWTGKSKVLQEVLADLKRSDRDIELVINLADMVGNDKSLFSSYVHILLFSPSLIPQIYTRKKT